MSETTLASQLCSELCQGGESLLYGRFALLIGDGAVGTAQNQVKGNALLTSRDMAAPIDIKQYDVFQDRTSSGTNSALHGQHREIVITYNGNITLSSRELGQGSVFPVGVIVCKELFHIQTGCIAAGIQFIALGYQRMDLAEAANGIAIDHQFGTASRMVSGVILDRNKVIVCNAQVFQDGFDGSLDGEEIAVAIHTHGQAHRLIGELLALHRNVLSCHFKQTDIQGTMAVVACQHFQHRRESSGAHNAGVLAQGVEDLHRAAFRSICRQPDFVIVLGADKGEGHDLIHTLSQQQFIELTLELLAGSELCGSFATNDGGGHLVIAVESGDFLCNVSLAFYIGTVGGNSDHIAVQLESKLGQLFAHELFRDIIGAKEAIDPFRFQSDLAGSVVGIVDVDDTVYHIAGIQQLYQFASAQNSRQTGGRIQPLFIAAGAFGAHSQIPGSDTDRRAEEVGGFKDDGGGILVDTTVLSALDTRYSRRLFAVAVTGSIGDIPMENIDHIEYVTGGAATTLYGSDAANGVIQIFTKKGAEQKTTFFAETQLEADIASSQFYHFKRTKELLHQTGFTQKYRVGFDGGTEKFGYSFGGSMSNGTGTLIKNGNEDRKYDLRFGSRMKFNEQFEYQNSFGMVIEDFARSRNGNQGGYTGLWFTEGAAATNFRYTDAAGELVNYGADLDALDDYTFAQMKAFVTKAEALQNNRESVKRFQTSQSLSYAPLANLTFKGVLGVDYRLNTNKNIITNEYLIHTQQKPEGTSDAGSISNFDRNYFGLTLDLNGQHKYRYKESNT